MTKVSRSAIATAALFLAFPVLAADLYGVTGESTSDLDPETLYQIDPADGATDFVLALGNGGAGEAIAFDPQDGDLRHASGSGGVGDRFWESIDVSIPTLVSSTQITGASTNEITSLVWSPLSQSFLATDKLGGYFGVTQGGVATLLGTAPSLRLKGMAFRGTDLYACNSQGNQLYRLDPATGASLGSIAMTIDDDTMEGCNGLAIDPETGVMWAVIRSAAATSRLLATVDPATGIVTLIGATGPFAGIAFLPEPPLPSALAAGLAAVMLGALRRRRTRPSPSAAPRRAARRS